MDILRMRSGLFGPIFIAAAIFMTGAGAAQATCVQAVAAFDVAVKTAPIDDAVGKFYAIGEEPGCKARDIEESSARLVDSLIDYAGTHAAEAAKTIELVERLLEATGNWRGKLKLGDYYFTHRDMANSHHWYQESAAILNTPGFDASRKEKDILLTKLAAAQSIASKDSDQEGHRNIHFAATKRDVDGGLGGVYSPAFLRGAIAVKVPVSIQFFYNEDRFTPNGEQAMHELTDAAAQMQRLSEAGNRELTMRLVGHADPQGTHDYNMELSRKRVIAVRDALAAKGIKADFKLEWVGDKEEFNWRVLPNAGALSQDDIYQLDRRVEWIRDGTPN
jgi:outer membrane protein OmpA-like peptidoglycan-associated protein